jgi:hypothetical protein
MTKILKRCLNVCHIPHHLVRGICVIIYSYVFCII